MNKGMVMGIYTTNFLFFGQYWGLNSGFHAYKADAYVLLESHLQSILLLIVEMGVSKTICLGWL
jgi:hypothetical protein